MKKRIVGLSLVAIVCIVVGILVLLNANHTQEVYQKEQGKNKAADDLFDHAISSMKWCALLFGVLGLGMGLVAISIKH